jgi:guanylate kinase
MNNEHILLCVMGKTATGKDSLVDALCQHNNIQKVISYTTRPR